VTGGDDCKVRNAHARMEVAFDAAERWCQRARELEREALRLWIALAAFAIAAAWGWVEALRLATAR